MVLGVGGSDPSLASFPLAPRTFAGGTCGYSVYPEASRDYSTNLTPKVCHKLPHFYDYFHIALVYL